MLHVSGKEPGRWVSYSNESKIAWVLQELSERLIVPSLLHGRHELSWRGADQRSCSETSSVVTPELATDQCLTGRVLSL